MVTRSARRRGDTRVPRWEPGYGVCWCSSSGVFKVTVPAGVRRVWRGVVQHHELVGWVCIRHRDPATWPETLPIVVI